MKEGLRLTGIGLVIGFSLSAIVALAFRGFFVWVAPSDLRTYAGVFVVLGGASILACYLPARRASRVDPLVTLRHE
jgi:ABC-type antimicrobial peptide transport system permease subunit